MMPLLKDLLASKKFIIMLATIALSAASKLGLNLDPELVNQILAIAAAYIVGQGIADNGKEAARLASKAVVTPPAPTDTPKEPS